MGKNSGEVRHYAKTSFWSGKAKTLCGLTMQPGRWADSSWFSSAPKCSACVKAKKEGRRP